MGAGNPGPGTVAPGTNGVLMMEVEMWAHLEPVVVTKFGVRHEGTGDPGQVSVWL